DAEGGAIAAERGRQSKENAHGAWAGKSSRPGGGPWDRRRPVGGPGIGTTRRRHGRQRGYEGPGAGLGSPRRVWFQAFGGAEPAPSRAVGTTGEACLGA